MATSGIGGGRVEEGLVGDAGFYGVLHSVVNFQNCVFCPVGSVFLYVFALNDREGIHDIGDGVARVRKVTI